MAEIVSISGFTPERLAGAMDLVLDCDVNAVIFRGMAETVHDQLSALHARNYEPGDGNKFTYPGDVATTIIDLGFDIAHFARQQLDAKVWPENSIQHTTIELIDAGRATSWHTDVARTDNDNELYLPYGVSFSLNLSGRAVFRVAQERTPFKIPDRHLSLEQLDILRLESEIGDIGEADVLEGVLEPGDLIFWRQPVPHQVVPLDSTRHSIVLIQEDYISSVD